MSLFGNYQELQFETLQCNGEPNSAQIQRTKEKNIEEGGEEFIGAVLNKAEFAV